MVPLAGLAGFAPLAHVVLAQVAAQQCFLPAGAQDKPSQGNELCSAFGTLSLPQKKMDAASVPTPAL
jgi:hypothetical protein